MKFDGFLLVSDFDGTLVDSNQRVSQENTNAINYFVKNGGLFCGATGRTQFNIRPYMSGLPINCPWILYNGACLYDFKKNRVNALVPVEREPLRAILKKIMAAFPQICVHLYTEDMMYLVNPSGIEDINVTREKQEFSYGQLDNIFKPWIKVILHEKNQVLQKAYQLIMEEDRGQDYHAFFSIDTYLEITQRQVSKGYALDLLKQEYEGRIQKVIAIGDYLNDLEMLQRADVKAAPSNAHPQVREIAEIITVHHDEHAVADLIQRLDGVDSHQ